MEHWRRIQLLLGGAALIPIVVLIAFNSSWLLGVVMALLVVIAFIAWIYIDRQRRAQSFQRMIEANHLTFLRTLNHHRHDWMNELQVLYGYIRLKKYEKLPHIVDKISENMAKDSHVSRLGDPSLALYLHSFRTVCNTLRLDVRVEGEVNVADLPIDVKQVSELVIATLNHFRFAVKPSPFGEPETLILTFRRTETELLVRIDTKDKSAMDELGAKLKISSPAPLSEFGECGEGDAVYVQFRVPFHT